jgi:Xaa-Pro aminopeptidase
MVPRRNLTPNYECALVLRSFQTVSAGTTDVTRTFHLGEPTEYQKNVFTRVLKGNIAIDSRVFPEGTPGVMLDAYAREHLWNIGKDFIHGVGHGVG